VKESKMKGEPRHKLYGRPMSEWIALVPGELDVDAVGLWQIVPAGVDGFGLQGEELIEYVRRNIRALLQAGAVPVRHEPGSTFEWTHQKQYGSEREEIIEAIIREWLVLGNDPMILAGEVWFARPDPKSPNYVKMD
jgi:hypothetical protein